MAQAVNWKDHVKEVNPRIHEQLVNYLTTVQSDPAIPDMYKQLIILGASTAIRYRSSMQTHSRLAMEAGATREQVFLAMALASMSSGFTCMIEATEVLTALDAEADAKKG